MTATKAHSNYLYRRANTRRKPLLRRIAMVIALSTNV